MKVTVKNEKAKIVSNATMAIGEIGKIISPTTCKGEIVLRAYQVLVSVEDPACTWSPDDSPKIEIELFPKGTEIILITE